MRATIDAPECARRMLESSVIQRGATQMCDVQEQLIHLDQRTSHARSRPGKVRPSHLVYVQSGLNLARATIRRLGDPFAFEAHRVVGCGGAPISSELRAHQLMIRRVLL